MMSSLKSLMAFAIAIFQCLNRSHPHIISIMHILLFNLKAMKASTNQRRIVCCECVRESIKFIENLGHLKYKTEEREHGPKSHQGTIARMLYLLATLTT